MRVLLRMSVLLTAALAWTASGSSPQRARASRVAAPDRDAPWLAPAAEPASAPAAEARPVVEVATKDGEWEPVPAEAVDADGEWVPLDVVAVDGESGSALQADRFVTAESRLREAPPMWRSPSRVKPADEASVSINVVSPDGYLGMCASATGYVSRRAERVRVLAPLRREAAVSVRAVDTAGRPITGARVVGITIGGSAPSRPVEVIPEEIREDVCLEPIIEVDLGSPVPFGAPRTDKDGWTRIRGIPHLLDERYWIVAESGALQGFADLLLGASESYEAEIRLPAAAWPPGVPLESRRGRGGRRNLACACRYRPSRLEVLVFRRDGSVASGVLVVGPGRGTTDEYGRVVFERLRPTTYEVEVCDPDFVWSGTKVELHGGESRIVEIVEPAGWTAHATLLDSKGRRVPFAHVAVRSGSGVEYARVVDGVQDLAFYTDARGEIDLPRMHKAPVTLWFDYGSRRTSLTIEEGDPYATVMLPPP